MRFIIRCPFKVSKEIFKVDKSFKTRSVVTKRTIEVAKAFGLGIDEEKEFIIFKDFEVEINPGDIVLVTGDSGSGKSLLLRELREQIADHKVFGKVIEDGKLKIDPGEILVEGVGRDVNEAINLLSQAGLNEAFLFLRRYRELSDGQKYRYKIAKMLDSGAGTWVSDEFAATLDRTTAKVVSFCIQKVARKSGKTLIVATTHEDLFTDLNPSIYVQKLFGFDVKVSYRENLPAKSCTVLSDLIIEAGTKEDYQRLEHFHYRAACPRFIKKIFRAKIRDELVGVILYVAPYMQLKARHYVLPMYKPHRVSAPYLKKLNHDFSRIGRVVVLPKFRNIGVGTELVRKTLPLVGTPYVETLAVMARYNPFFEKAGMLTPKQFEWRDREYEKGLQELEEMGFDLNMVYSKSYTLSRLKRFGKKDMARVKKFCLTHCTAEKFRPYALRGLIEQGDLEALAQAFKLLRLPTVYFIWKNPQFAGYPDPCVLPHG